MTAREEGFLLLTSQLGDPNRRVLTTPQLRMLGKRVQGMHPDDPNRDLTPEDLAALGYSRQMATRIVSLLADRELLEYYLLQAKKAHCCPLTRLTAGYPEAVRAALGQESPGVLWAKGEVSILQMPAISLVGSRNLDPENRTFAEEVGRQAALQGYALVSGNARGADQAAQNACLRCGGKVISVVADVLREHRQRENVLYLSEDGFDATFSAQRALSRNRVIHSLGQKVFVAQCGYQTGGTWDGTVKNLRFGWRPVFCFRDGSPAQKLLEEMGADSITGEQLGDLSELRPAISALF